jgi:hypothetical protein
MAGIKADSALSQMGIAGGAELVRETKFFEEAALEIRIGLRLHREPLVFFGFEPAPS